MKPSIRLEGNGQGWLATYSTSATVTPASSNTSSAARRWSPASPSSPGSSTPATISSQNRCETPSGMASCLSPRKCAAGRRFCRVRNSGPASARRQINTATASTLGRSTTSTRYTREVLPSARRFLTRRRRSCRKPSSQRAVAVRSSTTSSPVTVSCRIRISVSALYQRHAPPTNHCARRTSLPREPDPQAGAALGLPGRVAGSDLLPADARGLRHRPLGAAGAAHTAPHLRSPLAAAPLRLQPAQDRHRPGAHPRGRPLRRRHPHRRAAQARARARRARAAPRLRRLLPGRAHLQPQPRRGRVPLPRHGRLGAGGRRP